jgi:sulfide:quinone oxidoreductase
MAPCRGSTVIRTITAPPQSAPDWIKASPLSVPGDPKGWVDIDKNTMQHERYPEIFALGDAGSSPNSKTGAAIRKQAPVVVQNVIDFLQGKGVTRHYDGYASCPIVTAHNRMLLAEFDYSMRPHKTVPFIDTQKERYDMWLLKRYGMPFMYWNVLMRGHGMTTPPAFAS